MSRRISLRALSFGAGKSNRKISSPLRGVEQSMESTTLPRPTTPLASILPSSQIKLISVFPSPQSRFPPPIPLPRKPVLAVKSPKGFGPPPNKTDRKRKRRGRDEFEDDETYGGDSEGAPYQEDTIPEVVTNRMMKRMGFSVGIPLAIGLMFFPFFYYLKVVAKLDVPTWIPVIVSFIFFGTALMGVSYGIVSSSWDPLREGSFWGWNEAQKNWPVFWQSLWGQKGK